MPSEFKVIEENYNKNIHKKRSMVSTFEEKVNDALRAGYKLINSQCLITGMYRAYVAFLVREN